MSILIQLPLMYCLISVFFFINDAHETISYHNDYTTDFKTLKLKIKDANKFLKDLAFSTLYSVKWAIKQRVTEQTNKLEQYYKSLDNVKAKPAYKNIFGSCAGNKVQDPLDFYKMNRVTQCYPNKNDILSLKKIKSKIHSLQKSIPDCIRSCKKFGPKVPTKYCIRRKLNSIYQRIFWIQFSFTAKLKKIMDNSDKCSSLINRRFIRNVDENLRRAEFCE